MTMDTITQLNRLAARRRKAMREIDEEIHTTIQEGRSERLTMAQMAKAVGMSRQGLYDLERRSKPKTI